MTDVGIGEVVVVEGGSKSEVVEERTKSGEVVITPDPTNYAIHHPLQHRWTLWHSNPQSKRVNSKTWEDILKNVMTISTVEEFWQVHQNIRPASSLMSGSDYHFFKEGIQPKWEDKHNAKGGKWVVTIPRAKSRALDQVWLHTLMSLIGEIYSNPDEVCGAVVSLRKNGDRVSLWTRTALNKDYAMEVGTQFKEVISEFSKVEISYQTHDDALRRSSSYSNKQIYKV